MFRRSRLKDPDALIRAGLVFLILASLWRWFVHPASDSWAGFIDGGTGVLYGLSIGCLLLGMKRKGGRRSMPGAGQTGDSDLPAE